MNVELREVTPEEREAFLEMLAHYLDELGEYELEWDPAPPVAAYARAFEDDPGGQRIDWIVADGERAGFLVSRVERDWPEDEREIAIVGECYVAAGYRRRGVGRTAVEGWLAEQRRRGVQLVEASVLVRNAPAREFWGRLGFEARSVQTVRKP